MPYKKFYDMQTEAFGSLPVLSLYYNSQTHQDCWGYLVRGVANGEPFLLVTGDYGMGKTLLSMKLTRLLDKQHKAFVQITDPYCSYSGILRQIAACLSIIAPDEDEHALLDRIYASLQSQKYMHSLTIIIDDAQELMTATLMRLRAFANFNRDGFFPLQVIFFAHPLFNEILGDPQLRALDQRIKRRQHLNPLTFNETKEYIYFRLFTSGAPGTPTFTDDACREICSSTGGIPRLINNISDSCLTRGASKKEKCISRETVREAVTSTQLPHMNHDDKRRLSGVKQSGANRLQNSFPQPPLAVTTQKQQQSPELDDSPREGCFKVARHLKRAFPVIAAACIAAGLIGGFLLRNFIPGKIGGFALNESVHLSAPAPNTPANNNPPFLASLEPTSTDSVTPSIMDHLTQANEAEATPEAPVVHALPPVDSVLPEFDANAPPKIQSARPLEISTNNPEIVSAEKRPRPFTVRLSSFKSLESAQNASTVYSKKTLVPFVAKKHIDLQASQKDGNEWWIFYAGSFNSHEEALLAMQSMNIPDARVIPMPYACRIGIYNVDDNTSETISRLEQLGFLPYTIDNGNGNVSLMIGIFNNLTNAEIYQQKLATNDIFSTVSFPGDRSP